MNQPDDRLKVDYEATVQYFLHLSEVRFKLLGALPALTALAAALLPPIVDPARGFAIASLGLLVTIGITIYDQRNTQIYDCLVARARRLEEKIQGVPPLVGGGPFSDRPARRPKFEFKRMRPALLWHDLALAIVYAACLGVWASLVQDRWSVLYRDPEAAPVKTGGLVFILVFFVLVALALLNDYEQGAKSGAAGQQTTGARRQNQLETPGDVRMSRAYRLMYGLLYPAVLGTVLLNIFFPLSRLVGGGSVAAPEFGIGKLVIAVGVTFHFIVDYMLSQEAPEHSWRGFAINCVVLVGLWVAGASIHIGADLAPNLQILCWALVGVYGAFLVYLWLIYKRLQSVPAIAAVEVFSLLWFIVGATWLMNLTFVAMGLFLSAILLLWAGNRAVPGQRGAR